MQSLKSTGKVHRIREEEEALLVAFDRHDGYFSVPLTPATAEMRAKILQARQDDAAVTFEYDRDLRIVKVV